MYHLNCITIVAIYASSKSNSSSRFIWGSNASHQLSSSLVFSNTQQKSMINWIILKFDLYRFVIAQTSLRLKSLISLILQINYYVTYIDDTTKLGHIAFRPGDTSIFFLTVKWKKESSKYSYIVGWRTFIYCIIIIGKRKQNSSALLPMCIAIFCISRSKLSMWSCNNSKWTSPFSSTPCASTNKQCI